VDFASRREGKTATVLMYPAATARSHHPGGVNALWLDGSVRFVPSAVAPAVWRAAGTRAGGEVSVDF